MNSRGIGRVCSLFEVSMVGNLFTGLMLHFESRSLAVGLLCGQRSAQHPVTMSEVAWLELSALSAPEPPRSDRSTLGSTEPIGTWASVRAQQSEDDHLARFPLAMDSGPRLVNGPSLSSSRFLRFTWVLNTGIQGPVSSVSQ